MYPCHLFCDTIIAECNQKRWSAWRRRSLALLQVWLQTEPRREVSSVRFKLYAKQGLLQKWCPWLTSDPSGQGKFIVHSLSFIHQKNPKISRLCFTFFFLWSSSLFWITKSRRHLTCLFPLHSFIPSNYRQKYFFIILLLLTDILLRALIFSHAVNPHFCWSHYCTSKRPLKCCLCMPLDGSRAFSSTLFTFAYPFLPCLCILLQSHDFHDKVTNTSHLCSQVSKKGVI